MNERDRWEERKREREGRDGGTERGLGGEKGEERRYGQVDQRDERLGGRRERERLF